VDSKDECWDKSVDTIDGGYWVGDCCLSLQGACVRLSNGFTDSTSGGIGDGHSLASPRRTKVETIEEEGC
jgi:hypothetical protein